MLAADQFIITPATRVADAARAHAAGDELRAIIAGYHWFTDWGRDTMISLEGLTLDTGRTTEAGYILRNYAAYVRDGLIPNLFPEGEHEGLYHTADATLWYFHAISRYVERTGDRETLRHLLPTLQSIIEHHQQGHAVSYPRRSRRRAARAGRAGLSTDLDGRQGRRLGRHAATRQGGRDQRPVVQRPALHGNVGRRAGGAGYCRGLCSGRTASLSPRSTNASGAASAATCTT